MLQTNLNNFFIITSVVVGLFARDRFKFCVNVKN